MALDAVNLYDWPSTSEMLEAMSKMDRGPFY